MTVTDFISLRFVQKTGSHILAKLNKFIIMPNHIHRILIINNNNHNKTKTVETRFIASVLIQTTTIMVKTDRIVRIRKIVQCD